QAKQSGNRSEIQKLEREFDRAKQMTQRINEAYAVLSDVNDRVAYDRYLSAERQRIYQEEIRRQRMRHWEGERRTVKSRPHSQNPNIKTNPKSEGIPWIFLLGLIVLMTFVSGLITNAFI